jgi:hypothetical protein
MSAWSLEALFLNSRFWQFLMRSVICTIFWGYFLVLMLINIKSSFKAKAFLSLLKLLLHRLWLSLLLFRFLHIKVIDRVRQLDERGYHFQNQLASRCSLGSQLRYLLDHADEAAHCNLDNTPPSAEGARKNRIDNWWSSEDLKDTILMCEGVARKFKTILLAYCQAT